MPKSKQRDPDNPEWTSEDTAKAIRFNELPESLQKTLSNRKRGPQKAPTKVLTSIRLSPDVLSAMRATGRGWQTLADETLRRHFLKRKPAG